MENAYVREFDNLHVTALNREMHERTVGYWYTVTSGAVASSRVVYESDLISGTGVS